MGGSTNHSAKAVQSVRDCLNELNITPTELSRRLGMANGSVGRWLSENRAPEWAVWAAKGMIKGCRNQKKSYTLLVVKVPQHQAAPLLQVVEAFGGSATEI